ncbi:peptidoglycan DD-metalloendopeptidase family protein [Orrella sp. JC864]|uniref:peptidoglycan DD-metalloendopeptidase family protein n=1 Tax=Orrella sp. JC864 TaxID=3120298 RepID=UPI00300A273A
MLDGQLALTDPQGRQPVPGGRAALAALALALALAGCASQQRAPVVDLSEQPTALPQGTAPAPGSTYVVKPRDTLYQVARAHNLNPNDLARWNNITDPDHLRIGQVLQLSGSGAAAAASAAAASSQPAPGAQAPAPGGAGVSQDGKIETRPLEPVQPGQIAGAPGTPPAATPPAAAPAPAPAPASSPARAADASLINWGWPANGPIIQGFTPATKGIDISGNPGDPIVAAADGKVMYSGNGVRGLGNLIIINHQNGFITAYAHNRTLLVQTGQDVKRGMRIAEMGSTDAASPRLHFELRRQGTPVNPLQYLPPR